MTGLDCKYRSEGEKFERRIWLGRLGKDIKCTTTQPAVYVSKGALSLSIL